MKSLTDKLLDLCSKKGIKRELTLSVLTVLAIITMIIAILIVVVVICCFPKVFAGIAAVALLVYVFWDMKRNITNGIDEVIKKRDKIGHLSE